MNLHTCPDCDSDLVQSTNWHITDQGFSMTLWCPSCFWKTETECDEPTAEAYDQEMERGQQELLDTLRRVMAANMEQEVESFCGALEADCVLPEDF